MLATALVLGRQAHRCPRALGQRGAQGRAEVLDAAGDALQQHLLSLAVGRRAAGLGRIGLGLVGELVELAGNLLVLGLKRLDALAQALDVLAFHGIAQRDELSIRLVSARLQGFERQREGAQLALPSA